MPGTAAAVAWGRRRRSLLALATAMLMAAGAALPSHAQGVEIEALEVQRDDEGVQLDFSVRFTLSHTLDEALHKGVPLHFAAQAAVYRYRWYWRDERISRVGRTWRLAWQPLTRTYRVSFGPLGQNYASLGEALGAVSRGARWQIAPPLAADEDRFYVDFTYRLDTSLLPRPMQIGIAGSADWQLSAERSVPVPEPVR
jgi:hypothetical protein